MSSRMTCLFYFTFARERESTNLCNTKWIGSSQKKLVSLVCTTRSLLSNAYTWSFIFNLSYVLNLSFDFINRLIEQIDHLKVTRDLVATLLDNMSNGWATRFWPLVNTDRRNIKSTLIINQKTKSWFLGWNVKILCY